MLPIKEPIRQRSTELDVRNATPPAGFEVKAPKGAPNVVVILIDDMGFGVSEAFGGPVAMDAPFSYTKQVASDFGGTRNGMIIQWPAGIKGKGELRSQFGHVIDIAPTVFEVAKLPSPKMVNGIEQDPIEGKSLAYTFNEAAAPEQHKIQYFEMFGNRGIYQDGWFA